MIDYLGKNQDITKDLVDVVNMSSNVTPAGFYGERQFGWSQYRKLDFFLRKTGISSSYLTFYLSYSVFNETNVASSIHPFQFKAFDFFFSPVCVNSLHVSCRFEKATLMMANYHLCKGAFVIITFVNMNKTNILFLNIGYYFRKKNDLMGHPTRLQKTCFVIWNAIWSQVRPYKKKQETFLAADDVS